MKKITGNCSTQWIQIVSFAILAIFCMTFTCHGWQTKDIRVPIPAGKAAIIKKLSPKEAFELIQMNKTKPDFVILDVRTPEEFESGHIEGAININYHSEAFVGDLDKLAKNKIYLVYCRTGRRSSDTVDIMTRQGFKELYRIDGDIIKWKALDLPVVKSPK